MNKWILVLSCSVLVFCCACDKVQKTSEDKAEFNPTTEIEGKEDVEGKPVIFDPDPEQESSGEPSGIVVQPAQEEDKEEKGKPVQKQSQKQQQYK